MNFGKRHFVKDFSAVQWKPGKTMGPSWWGSKDHLGGLTWFSLNRPEILNEMLFLKFIIFVELAPKNVFSRKHASHNLWLITFYRLGQSTGLPPVRTWDGDIKHVLKRTSVLIVAISKLTNLNHQKGFITVAESGSKISHILSELNLKHPLSIFAEWFINKTK